MPCSSRNHLLESNPITSPGNKFKNFSREIDSNLSQDYIRRQLYAYGILHSQATASAEATANTTGRRTMREEFSNDRGSEMISWNHLKTTQVSICLLSCYIN